eukprot:SAG11_NODE_28386_length_322_cov_0.901345_1_plen_59_part_10
MRPDISPNLEVRLAAQAGVVGAETDKAINRLGSILCSNAGLINVKEGKLHNEEPQADRR